MRGTLPDERHQCAIVPTDYSKAIPTTNGFHEMMIATNYSAASVWQYGLLTWITDAVGWTTYARMDQEYWGGPGML